MDYKIVLSRGAEEDLDGFVAYLLFEKKSEQAARNLLNDFEATKTSLSNVAGSLKLCDNPKLRELGYYRINFLSHRYFMLYRIENDTVYVDNVFHELQDYENKLKSGEFCKYDRYSALIYPDTFRKVKGVEYVSCEYCGKMFYYNVKEALYHKKKQENDGWQKQKHCSVCNQKERCHGCGDLFPAYKLKGGYCWKCNNTRERKRR